MQWLAEICVHRPVFATVIVMFLTVVGGFSFFTLGVDRFPKIDLPTISISTSNPGSAPEEMESEVTDVVEGAVNTVPGIDEMRSNSSKGSSNVTLTFNLDKDPDQAFQEIQQKISTVINRLPETADPPVVRKSDPDSQPVLMYSMSAPRSTIELNEMAQNLIQKRIESADGVGEVVIFGGRPRQIKIYIDPKSEVGHAFGARGLPTSFLIDREGKVLGRVEGAAEWDSPKILGVLEPLLSGNGVVKASSR